MGLNKTVTGAELPVTENNKAVVTGEEIVVVWRQLFTRKNRNVVKKNGVITGKKDFVASIRKRDAQTSGVVA